jgi:hypothetical protein
MLPLRGKTAALCFLILVLKISNVIIIDLSWLANNAPEGLPIGSIKNDVFKNGVRDVNHRCHLVTFANNAPEGLPIGSIKYDVFKNDVREVSHPFIS